MPDKLYKHYEDHIYNVLDELKENDLQLREKAINSNYIFTTELGSIKSKEEYSSTYHFGGFVNHENFFIGYTAFNFGFNHFCLGDKILFTDGNCSR